MTSKETNIAKALAKRNNKTDTLAILSVMIELQKSDNIKLESLFNATTNVKELNDNQTFGGVRLVFVILNIVMMSGY